MTSPTHPDVLASNAALADWEDADTAYFRAIYGNAGTDKIRALDTARRRAETAYYRALAAAMDATP